MTPELETEEAVQSLKLHRSSQRLRDWYTDSNYRVMGRLSVSVFVCFCPSFVHVQGVLPLAAL